MKTTLPALCGLAAGLLGASAKADIQDVPGGNWYVSPLTGIVVEDSDGSSDTGYGLHLGFGRRITDHWNLEIGFAGDRVHHEARQDRVGVSVDFVRMLGDDGIAPYVVFGAGYLKSNFRNDPGIPGFDPDYDNITAAVGAGIFTPMRWSGGRFRADARYRIDGDSRPDHKDLLVQIGMQLPLTRSRQPVVDSDYDGVPDGLDVCPATPMQYAVDKYGCEHDTDGDGVADREDTCPDTGHSTPVDAGGCRL